VVVAGADSWIWWAWVGDHQGDIASALREHVVLTVVSVGLGLLLSLPVAVLAQRHRVLLGPSLAIAGLLYTIPSLAAFALLVPWTGLTATTAVIPLTAYTMFILIRSVVTGLDGVPPEVVDAADGMGFRSGRRLVAVELPLALPSILAGVRLATVTTIGLVTVTSVITLGGLGSLIYDGFRRDFRTPLVVGIVLSVALAVAADLAIVGVGKLLMPWSRRRAPT
jgi:osmoprotectant transport system permease protein